MKEKHIKIKNHLPSRTPTSQLLSYLGNLDMFDEIVQYCKEHNLLCSIYVDDITLSTNRKVSFEEEKQLKAIIKKYGQKISKEKTVRYNNNEYKKVTGFVISPQHQLTIANKTRLKIKQKLLQIEDINNVEIGIRNSLIGLTNFTEISKKNAYNGLKKQLKDNQHLK